MEDKLLFASGSTVVDKEGEKALTQLAEVLANNPDISIRIEGHTDNVPISGGPIKDNWDLSVLRATSVLRILTKHGNITPERLVPSGRGQYVPLDEGNSPEARRKNRRTEIILIPKLNELLEALDKK
jgi:chemotaxis protein MotB